MRTVDPETWPKKLRKNRRAPAPLAESASLEARLRRSWCGAAREYRAHCSLTGAARLSRPSLSTAERWQHGVVWAACVCWGAWAAAHGAGAQRGAGAQLVARHEVLRSPRRVPFPAVALCSTGLVARPALDNVTAFLVSRVGNSSYDEASIGRLLLQFGALVTGELPATDVGFLQLLARALPALNVTDLMRAFSPPCGAMLRRCSWRGQVVPCDHLFAARVTPLGFCCVFNSRYHSEDLHRPPKYLDMVGQDYGLSVIVHENPEDFAYVRRATVGVDVLIFDGSEYPILEGGGVRLYPMEQNTSAFLSVATTAQEPLGAVPGCARRGPASRYAACLTECRRRTLAVVCGCRLHTLPPDPADKTVTCSLIHLSCLNKHREKLIYYYPAGYSTPALEEELQNAQECEECAPDCWRLQYAAAGSVARHSRGSRRKLFRRLLTEGISLVNATVIHLFYPSEYQKLYSIEASKHWYEPFAAVGSVWCGVTGASAGAACELLFYLAVRWPHHFRRAGGGAGAPAPPR